MHFPWLRRKRFVDLETLRSLARRLVVIGAFALGVSSVEGCAAEIAPAPPPPYPYDSYPYAYYDGRPVYLVDGYWYYPVGNRWYYYRREPRVLLERRAEFAHTPRGVAPPPYAPPPRAVAPPPYAPPSHDFGHGGVPPVGRTPAVPAGPPRHAPPRYGAPPGHRR